MYIDVTWLDGIELSDGLAEVRESFKAEYARRYGMSAGRGLYKDGDWARIAFCHAHLARFGGSVLDVGIGPGALLNALAADPRFDRVTGIDIRRYSKLVELAPDLDIRLMDVREMEFEDGSYDSVVCMEVLEHLEEESFQQALAELRRVAARRLFLSVPFREPEPLSPYHKKRFDFADIERHFAGADFHILKPQHGVPWIVILQELGSPARNRSRSPGSDDRVEILRPEAFSGTEAADAKAYWADVPIDFYERLWPWSDAMGERILAFDPRSVFEFGCNTGKNLARIAAAGPEIAVSGMEVNGAAVELAQQQSLDVVAGDESTLGARPPLSVDVSFTLSGLSHLPDPEAALAALARQSRRAVLVLEPWLGEEGRVIRNADRESGEIVDTTPFSYSWDYEALTARVLPGWTLTVEDHPLESNLGRYCKLYTMVRPEGVAPDGADDGGR